MLQRTHGASTARSPFAEIRTQSKSGAQRIGAGAPTIEAIAKLAYAKFLARGRVDGFDKDDWEAATRELEGLQLERRDE
jgi:hypothetical protein